MSDQISCDDAAHASATVTDRRRPGRVDYLNPHLVALLQGRHQARLPENPGVGRGIIHDAGDTSDDPLAPARGIGIGVVVSAVIWAALATALWMLSRHWGPAIT
jgi:hypothetical protein